MKLAYIDSSVWITRIEGFAQYKETLNTKLIEMSQDGWQFCASDAVFLEVLAKPYKQNQSELISEDRNVKVAL